MLLQAPKETFHREQKKVQRSRILVAEDNKLNQQVIRKMLSSLGFDSVEIAENGKIAVEAAMKIEFDIILMDVMVSCVMKRILIHITDARNGRKRSYSTNSRNAS